MEELFKLTPGDIATRLGCSEDQRRQAWAFVSRLRTLLSKRFESKGIFIQQLYLGGSLRKGTALNYRFDADLVLVLDVFDKTQLNLYHRIIREVSLPRGQGSLYGSRRCTTLVFAKPMSLKVDVLVTGAPLEEHIQRRDDFYSPACSEAADSVLAEVGKAVPEFLPFVMLCKHWRNCALRFPRKCKSYHIELLCSDIVKNSSSATFMDWLESFFSRVAENRCDVENINPCGYLLPHSFGSQAQRCANKVLEQIREAGNASVLVKTAMRGNNNERSRKKHPLQLTSGELRELGWDGAQYFSHSQNRMAPYILGFDSDSDDSYDALQYVPGDELDRSRRGRAMRSLMEAFLREALGEGDEDEVEEEEEDEVAANEESEDDSAGEQDS